MARRDWSLARAKVEQEGRCRLADKWVILRGMPEDEGMQACDGRLEAAHTIGVSSDDTDTVQPYDIIPLCTYHHARYDARRISILHVLTLEEQAAAVQKLGLIRALRRLTSGTTEAVERPTE